MSETQLERSVLEAKEREELVAIADALGAKPAARAKKADLVTQILRATGIEAPASEAPPDGAERPKRTRARKATAAAFRTQRLAPAGEDGPTGGPANRRRRGRRPGNRADAPPHRGRRGRSSRRHQLRAPAARRSRRRRPLADRDPAVAPARPAPSTRRRTRRCEPGPRHLRPGAGAPVGGTNGAAGHPRRRPATDNDNHGRAAETRSTPSPATAATAAGGAGIGSNEATGTCPDRPPRASSRVSPCRSSATSTCATRVTGSCARAASCPAPATSTSPSARSAGLPCARGTTWRARPGPRAVTKSTRLFCASTPCPASPRTKLENGPGSRT